MDVIALGTLPHRLRTFPASVTLVAPLQRPLARIVGKCVAVYIARVVEDERRDILAPKHPPPFLELKR